MKQSEIYRQNAENCAYLAEDAPNEPARQRYKRMEAAWRALRTNRTGLMASRRLHVKATAENVMTCPLQPYPPGHAM
jgi:hypothetical protein